MTRTTLRAARPTAPSSWHLLSREQKRERLRQLRRDQQRDIEAELRLLTHLR